MSINHNPCLSLNLLGDKDEEPDEKTTIAAEFGEGALSPTIKVSSDIIVTVPGT